MVNIQKRPPPILNATANQVVAKKEVLREAFTPYALATESSVPVTMEDWTVAMTEAARMVTVERPEMRKVRHEPTREQIAKSPKTNSTTQVMNAMM